MGSNIELNAILKLTSEDGMPDVLEIGSKHQFKMTGERLFQFYPNSVTLIHEINAKWKFVGQARVMKQTIDAEQHITTGEFIVTRVFTNESARIISAYEAPDGKSFYELDDRLF